MITLNGKYNFANVMLDKEDVDDGIRNQIMTFLDHPAFRGGYIAIMPDCHVGKGSVIGFTMKLNQYVIPNIVGVDIGCGVVSYCLGDKIGFDRVSFEKRIREKIPLGQKHHQKSSTIIDKYMTQAYLDVAKKIGMKEDILINSIGTLGGGNHFIEVDEDSDGKIWLTVHSGSRNFGLRVAAFWQTIAEEMASKFFYEGSKELSFLPLDLGGSGYLNDMYVAQAYAVSNRIAIIENILGKFDPVPNETFISSVHNYISTDDSIIRKGAISARAGEKCIIPFNSKEGLAICMGKGNKMYNFSAPHGAGRLYSRSQMNKQLLAGTITVEGFKKELEDAGVYTTTANKDTIDEAPEAYKSKELILKHIAPTVTVLKMMKPIMNIKASE